MGSPSALNVDLAVLPDVCVHVASLGKSRVPVVLHELLRLLFFSEAADRFLQCSIMCDRVTLIASLEDLAPFGDELMVDATAWRVVRVSDWCTGDETAGVVERITARLAAATVPVLYVSTFSLDYVLIPCDRLADALSCLGVSDSEMPTAAGGSHEPSERSPQPVPASTTLEAAAAEPLWHTHRLCVLEGARTQNFRLAIDTRQCHTGALLRLLFLERQDDAQHALRALIQTPEEISLTCGDVDWFMQYCEAADGIEIAGSDPWIPIRIGSENGTPLSEVGVVATQAHVLMEAKIPILYHTTLRYDITFVPERDLQRAVDAFEDFGVGIDVVVHQAYSSDAVDVVDAGATERGEEEWCRQQLRGLHVTTPNISDPIIIEPAANARADPAALSAMRRAEPPLGSSSLHGVGGSGDWGGHGLRTHAPQLYTERGLDDASRNAPPQLKVGHG